MRQHHRMHQMIVSKVKSARQLLCTDVPQEEVLSVIIECNALSLKFVRFDMKKGKHMKYKTFIIRGNKKSPGYPEDKNPGNFAKISGIKIPKLRKIPNPVL